MTRLLLLRHAAHGLVDRVLCGRMPGVHLGAAGWAQAAALSERIARERPVALHASPQPRARETAAAIAERLGLEVTVEPALDEIDMGAWTGRAFAELALDPEWRRWNAARAEARPPGGESMAEAGARLARWMAGLPARHGGATVAAVSHADVIKAGLCGVLGLALDAHWRFRVAPASLSALLLAEGRTEVVTVNEELPADA